MKILLFSTQWPEYMIELSNSLAYHGDVILMIPDNHRFTEKHFEQIGPTVKVELFKVVLYKSLSSNFKMLFFILRKVWKYRPEILHVQANGHRLFYWIFLLKPRRTKIVNTIHDPVKHTGDKLSHAIDDGFVKKAARFFTKKYIVHGDWLIHQLENSHGVPKDRIVSIPHGNFEIYKRFQTTQVEQDENVILFFGRIWAYKGLEYFVQAANIVSEIKPDAKFHIVGVGEDLDKYLQQIEHTEKFVIVNKRVSIDEAGQYFQKSSIVVLPYIEATQSGVIPVAYAYSKPVIATNVGGLPEVVINGKTGYLVEPRSSEQIAEKIIFLLNNPDIKNEMGKAAYEFAAHELSWERIAKRHFDLYKSLK